MSAGNEAAEAFENTGLGEAIVTQLTKIVDTLNFNNQSATTVEAFAQQLNLREPTLILGVDATRRRALLRANTTDVYVGRYSELTSSRADNIQGYLVSSQAGDEIKNIDVMYAIYNPTGTPATSPVYIHVLVERETNRA